MNRAKTLRREQAEARWQQYLDRTPQQQLERLDAKLGVGRGAARERAELEQKIERGGPEMLLREIFEKPVKSKQKNKKRGKA